MAFTYGFYNYDKNDSGDSKLYDAQQMSQIFDGIIEDGVYAHVGDRFNVTATGTGVKVGSGRAWFNHTWNYNDSNLTLTAPAAPTTGSRIDAVVIDINANRNARTNTIKWVQGNPASSPVKPTLEHTTLHNQYALAYVTRTAGTSTISDSDIENAVGRNGTPYVTGVLQQISASQILASFENQFEGFLNAKESDFETFISNHDASFQQFINSEEGTFDEYIASKDQDFQDYIAGNTAEFNSVMQSYRNDFDSFKMDCENAFDSLMFNSRSQFETFMTHSSTDFDNFISGLDDRFESFMSGLEPRCEEYIRRYALVAEGWATGNQNGTPTSIAPYFHNNAKYHADRAKESADKAEVFSSNPPYIGDNGNWYIWNTSTNEFVDSGIDASITVQIADVSMLATGETPRVTNTGTNTDPVFHLFIPYGVYISNVVKTGTSGSVDTYRINFTNGTNTTFTVTNGKSAYQAAKDGGYTGTELEFNDELANVKDYYMGALTAEANAANSERNAANSAFRAETSESNASTSASTAQARASEASNSASAASTKATEAASSASTASTKASEASASATNAASSASTASTKATEASTSATAAATSASMATSKATEASDSATLSESYAKGGTNTRTGENTDNALYFKDLAKTYAENAEAVTGIGIATTSRAGIVKPDGETIFVDANGKITGGGISDTDWATLEQLFQ